MAKRKTHERNMPRAAAYAKSAAPEARRRGASGHAKKRSDFAQDERVGGDKSLPSGRGRAVSSRLRD